MPQDYPYGWTIGQGEPPREQPGIPHTGRTGDRNEQMGRTRSGSRTGVNPQLWAFERDAGADNRRISGDAQGRCDAR